MDTLIEMYDERPLENVLASEVFQPRRTVFLCPKEVAADEKLKSKLKAYYRHMGLSTELVFMPVNMYSAKQVADALQETAKRFGGCVADVTGGSDAALFACGMVCAETDMPAFTYSRRNNAFYNIQSAPFASPLPCTVRHTVEDCFLMAGGALRRGRVDNAVLDTYMKFYDPFFEIYLRHRVDWTRAVNYIVRASQTEKGSPIGLTVNAARTVKGERGNKLEAPDAVLRELERMGFLLNYTRENNRVSFTFRDAQVRTWLRDIGSVLELYVYKVCRECGLFNDVLSSAVVDWEGDARQDNVTNEIDVMAMRGILPVFISCKTCAVTTEALNELAILRDRFGGKGARAAVVTTQRCRPITRHRAMELDMDVIDLDDLKAGHLKKSIVSLVSKE